MQFIDLKKQYSLIQDNIKVRFDDILENARFIMGKEVSELEERLSGYVGVKHCITCASGTDALLIPLMAYGISHKDVVFVPSFTFFASAEVIALTGATPIFIDIKPNTFNMDPIKLETAIKAVLEEGKFVPKAIMPVDLFGLPAEYDRIIEIANKYNLIVLEDGAQGFGGSFKNKKACSFGHVSATSFFPAKPLGCYGDGGAVFTDDDDLAEIMKSIRVHGSGSDRYDNVRIGLNGRMDTLQAAVLLEKIRIFDNEVDRRNDIAAEYTERLKDHLIVPQIQKNYRSSWAQYSLLAKDSSERERIVKHLKEKDIPVMIYYPIPLHKQTAFITMKNDHCDLSVSESIAEVVFSIPMHPYLEAEEIMLIIDSIKECLQ